MSEEVEEKEKPQRDPATGRFLPGNSGGGRKPGYKNIVSREAVQKLANMGVDPLEFLAQVMDNPEMDVTSRQKAADKLIEYAYSKQPSYLETKVDGAIPVLVVEGKGETDDIT